MGDFRAFDIAGHKLTPLHAPGDRLAKLLEMIETAQKSIQLVIYIYSEDRTGSEIRDAMIRAAQRGVSVRLMIDSFGSAKTRNSFFSELVDHGGELVWFSSRWNIGYFIRNHQKIIVADRKSAVVGGFNIADSYFGRAGDKSWEDFGLHVEGARVEQLACHVDALFADAGDGGVRFRKLRKMIDDWDSGDGQLQWLLGGPTNLLSPWARQFSTDLEQGERFDSASAYFTPTTAILRRISKLTRKGGGGQQILAGKTDNGATIGAARLLYNYLLKRGARLFEYQQLPLHMKLLVIDDVCYIGSANLDVRSLFINMEIMLRVEDRQLADYLRDIIGNMADNSKEQTQELHKARATWFRRIYWGLAYLMVGTVDYTIGKRIKFSLLRKQLAISKSDKN